MIRLFLSALVVAAVSAVPAGALSQDRADRPMASQAASANDRMPFPALMNALFGRDRPAAAPAPRFHRPGAATAPTPRIERATPPDIRAVPPAPRPTTHPIDPRYERQVVAYAGGEAPGTVIVDTSERFLYLVQDDGTALRYGVGVGREGFSWRGSERVTRKAEWPSWRPPEAMKRRQPGLPDYMPGGPDNPLGARALYLGDTLYRIHGSNEPWTIGQAVSSGCIRMTNADVIDLYDRVSVGARVIVR